MNLPTEIEANIVPPVHFILDDYQSSRPRGQSSKLTLFFYQ